MKNILTIWIPVLIFHLLFWDTEFGLNLLLFSIVLTGAILIKKTYVIKRKEILFLLAAWNIAAFFYVLHDTILSGVTYWLLFFVLIGFLQQLRVKFWLFGLVESIRALFAGWAISGRTRLRESTDGTNIWPFIKKAKLLFIPLLIIIPFYLIYTQANADFGNISNRFWGWFNGLFIFNFDGVRVAHFILSIVVVFAAIGKRYGIAHLHRLTDDWGFQLTRKKRPFAWAHKTLALKREYQIAVISFISLNILLAFVNMLDISDVWLSFDERSASELSQYVHQGTYLLIFSILLAMGVVLGFLRGNLNFYQKNKTLLLLTYAWLAQNAFLAISVAIRNGHYIHRYGLAQGRIQVIFFLILVLFGLYSMYQKVRNTKTIFYLIQTNGQAFVFVLLLACTVNWDATITRYNLKHHTEDTRYLTYRLRNNLLPLLADLKGEFGAQPSIELKQIISKGESHTREWENSDWRSWTWSAYRQYWAWKEFNGEE